MKHGRKRIAALAALEAASLPWRGDPGHAITSLGFTLNHALNDPAGRLIASFGSVADWAVRIAQICGLQGDSHNRARIKIHCMFGLVSQVRTAVLHPRNPCILIGYTAKQGCA